LRLFPQYFFNGSMSKTLKLEAKTPKKKLLKKTLTKTRKSVFLTNNFFSIFLLEFLSVYFCECNCFVNFLYPYFYLKSTFDNEMVEIYVFWSPLFWRFFLGVLAENLRVLGLYPFFS